MDIIIYGIINSVSLALMALGFTLVYGVSRLPNFAHGALYVLTGYIAWLLMNRLGLNYPLSILFSLCASAAIGAAMYYFILVRVRGMPISEIRHSASDRWGRAGGRRYSRTDRADRRLQTDRRIRPMVHPEGQSAQPSA